MKQDTILLEHGDGGVLTHRLIAEVFMPRFSNTYLDRCEDGAILSMGAERFCFTTDSYVINPIFFPGGDIGSLAVHGTVNDLSVCGAVPRYISAGFIIEEGFSVSELEKITSSMASAAQNAGVQVVTGDTKVVHKGSADGLFINTAGIGTVSYPGVISVLSICEGDAVIVNGTVGDHGSAVLHEREDLGLSTDIISDSAPLNSLVSSVLEASTHIHCMRDATRGGLGGILAEIAGQSKFTITIDEKSIPLREDVRGICEILGFDPLYLANEGKMVVFCPQKDAATVLDVMKGHEYGRDASIIGAVNGKGAGRLVLNTVIGGQRVLDIPSGELVPRIC